MKVYITKYALTKGIYSCGLIREDDDGGCYAIVDDELSPNGQTVWSKGNWHKTKIAAISRAEQMRIKKLASLKKQIKKIEGLDFGKGLED